jgi:hypothetical protein
MAALNLTWFRAHSAIDLIPATSASAAPAASEAAPAAFPPGPAANAFFFGPGFTNRNGVAQKLSAVEPSDGFLGRFFGLHFHEPESSGNPSVPVLDDVYGDDFTHFGEVRFQIFFGDLHGQISDVKVLVHNGLPSFFIIPLSDLKRKIFKGFHPPKEIAFGIPSPSNKKPPWPKEPGGLPIRYLSSLQHLLIRIDLVGVEVKPYFETALLRKQG